MRTCASCIFYLTDDEDENSYHHDENSNTGFCAIRDLFYNVDRTTEACPDYEEGKARVVS